jgi:hypothetical protein
MYTELVFSPLSDDEHAGWERLLSVKGKFWLFSLIKEIAVEMLSGRAQNNDRERDTASI